MILKKTLLAAVCLAGPLFIQGCDSGEEEVYERKLGFEEFVPQYNKYVDRWLDKQLESAKNSKSEKEAELAKAETDDEKKNLESELKSLGRNIAKLKFRKSLDGYFTIKTEKDVPTNLKWENGDHVPPMGDSRAKKGGTLNTYVMTFPATVRRFGKNSNNSFRGYLYDNIEMGLVGRHSLTGDFFGILASEWAVAEDGKTVYYKLRKEAKYSDGTPVVARDYMVWAYLRLSDNVKDPFYKQFLREQYANISTYGDHMISVTLPEAKPLMPYYAAISPAPSHFYKEYGPDYVQRYQWKVEPSTGAYTVKDTDIKKGRSITLSRVKDWWGSELPQFKYAFNPDKIVYHMIQDESKAFELFRIGKLDYLGATRPEYWYEKTEIEPVFKGYVEKATFYNIYPRVPRGLYFNVTKAPVDNKDVREGAAYAMNFTKVINALFRGDYDRLESFSRGYGEFTNENLKARRYSISKARAAFAKAGYTEEGADGILRTPGGKRLEIEVTFSNVAYYPKMMAILQEEAKKAGLHLILDGQEPTLAFKKAQDKLHQVSFTGWGVTPPFPRYYQFFHSKNAVDENGDPKKQTNNLNCYGSPRMDPLTETVRNARTLEELKSAAHEVQQIVHDEVLFVPSFTTPYRRIAYWRWLKWPNSKYTQFADPKTYSPDESYYYWIDEDIKKETIKAKRAGKELGEKVHVFDRYRDGVPAEDKMLRLEK